MTRILTLLTLLLFTSCLFAQDDTTKATSLEEVVFTANKYPKKQSETGKVLTVIGSEQLERTRADALAPALGGSPASGRARTALRGAPHHRLASRVSMHVRLD